MYQVQVNQGKSQSTCTVESAQSRIGGIQGVAWCVIHHGICAVQLHLVHAIQRHDTVELANMNRFFFHPDQVGMTKTDAAVQTLSEINPDVVLEVQKQNAILPLSCFLLHAWVECGCVFMSGDDEMMTQNSIVQFVNWMIKRYENIKLLQRFGNNEDDILIYQYNTVLQSVG
ncbi:uncharacterized protein [Elaeis guineensis]|uniref:uncharacterized protein isoform X3 n=1 Tax=Elaeis guineensis var. tenera TaxID=51953 RepID=UPI003C6D3C12